MYPRLVSSVTTGQSINKLGTHLVSTKLCYIEKLNTNRTLDSSITIILLFITKFLTFIIDIIYLSYS